MIGPLGLPRASGAALKTAALQYVGWEAAGECEQKRDMICVVNLCVLTLLFFLLTAGI